MINEKKRILIIDDEEGASRLLQWNLEGTELYDVEVVNLPLKALSTGEKFMPDLILMDVVMPDISGGKLAQQFCRDKTVGKVPVVFLTAVVEKPEVLNGKSWISGRDYLAKPVELSEVLSCLEVHLGKTQK